MRYLNAFEYVQSEIDAYYQFNYHKPYFDFKADDSFKMAQICLKSVLATLDNYKFNKYIPHERDVLERSYRRKLSERLQKMYLAMDILGLLSIYTQLTVSHIKRLNIDIKPLDLYRLHKDLTYNFSFLKAHLTELIIRFYPSKQANVCISIVYDNTGSVVPLLATSPQINLASKETFDNVNYEYDDIIGEGSTGCFCCFFSRKRKNEHLMTDRTEDLNEGKKFI